MSRSLAVLVVVPFFALACDDSKTVIPDSGQATEDSGTPSDTDTGGTGGGSGSGSGGGSGSGSGSGSGEPRDVDGDGYSPDDLLDCNDNDATVNVGAAEILGDGIDQDCDGIADDLSFSEVPGFVSCDGARSPRLATNSTHTFATVLCTEARLVPEGETEADDYFDSAIAFGWSHDSPQGPPAGVYDWVRNSSEPPTTLQSGQGFVATDTALFGALAVNTDSGTIFRIGGYDLEADGRFSVTFNGSLATDAFDQIEVAVDPVGGVHAIACDDDSGAPRYLGGTTEAIRGSDFEHAESLGALGSPGTCALHFANGGQGTLVSRDSRDYTWATFDPAALPPDSLSTSVFGTLAPALLRAVVGPSGSVSQGGYVVFQDEATDDIAIQDASTSPDVAAVYQWDLPDPTTLSAAMSADGTVLAVAMLDRSGAPVLAIGPPSGTPTTYTPTFPTGVGTIDELEVQLDPTGSVLWLAATNERALYVGAVVVP